MTYETELHPVYYGREDLAFLPEWVAAHGYSRVAILCDTHTERDCLPLLGEHFPEATVIRIPAGEVHKNPATLMQVWERMTAAGLDRRSLLICLGGGVVTDLGGFAAATFKRGIPFIHLPTTLLAQVDAALGGKTGIDLLHFKNQVGTFTQPAAVVLHRPFLRTLAPEELRSGFAEMLKHALLTHQAMWEDLMALPGPEAVTEAQILAAMRCKLEIVQRDPLEHGDRRLLNLGHTLGHALESWFLSSGQPVRHGEAVAAGLITEAFLAQEYGLAPAAWVQEITAGIDRFFPRLLFPAAAVTDIAARCLQDKKNQSGRIEAVLPAGYGRALCGQAVSLDAAARSLIRYLNS